MIILIRHCTPNIDYSKCNYYDVLNRVKEYNATQDIDICEIYPFIEEIKLTLQNQPLVIFSSIMNRAIITVKNLFPNNKSIIYNKKFVEFDLNIIKLPILKLKFKTWLIISRILWFLGLIKSQRSVADEIQRAKECAELMHNKTQEGAVVVLVAHGMLNLFIENSLKRKGYFRIYKRKNKCFSFVILHNHN